MAIKTVFFIFTILFIFQINCYAGGRHEKYREPAETGIDIRIDVTQTDEIFAWFFYGELCGNCRTDIERFYKILDEKLPLAERDTYLKAFTVYNIFEEEGRWTYIKITDDLGLDRETLETPLLIMDGRVFQGYDNIGKNISEVYFAAAEKRSGYR